MTGILLIDKPAGWTSMDVCSKLRRIAGERRIGHSGTLDPMATGLLVVFLGRATRAVEFAEAHEKAYQAALRLGMETDTLDTTGTILRQREASIGAVELERALQCFRGEIDQLPPMYSAIKQGGKKLYEIARAGGTVDRKTRRVVISSLVCTGQRDGDFLLDIVCSKGTYIRSLCADIGTELGCGGCMSALRRTRAGLFRVEDAYTMDTVIAEGLEGKLLPVDRLFADFPDVTVEAKDTQRIRNGNEIRLSALADGTYRVYGPGEEFLMLGLAENGVLKTIKSFFEVG